ncbi:MAG: hypothetical protein VX875_05770 [Pseudomonadota bacterium]|jgi:hypothetical protein|nr:hypothetical protein [Pseudomonadota bacterium]
MHEIEDLVEATIRTIDILDIPSHEKRQLIANCYRAQAYFDTSYTHFRLMDVLLRNDWGLLTFQPCIALSAKTTETRHETKGMVTPLPSFITKFMAVLAITLRD